MFKVSIDLGYGYVKGVNSNNEKVLFPSIISKNLIDDSSLDSLKGIFEKDKKTRSIEDMEKELEISVANVANGTSFGFKVGKAAQLKSNASYLLDDNKINSVETKILLAASSVLLFPEEEIPIYLITGLPISQYKFQKEAFKKMLLHYKCIVSIPKSSITRVIKFKKVDIIPQGVGAVYNSVWKDIKTYTIPNTYIVYVDWGYKTIDYVVFAITGNGMPKVQPQYSGSLNNGMYQIGLDANKIFEQKTGALLEIADLNRLVSNGKIWYNGGFVEITKELEEIKKERARKVAATIRADWADILPKISTTFIGGGGGVTMYEFLKDFFINSKLVSEAQMGNSLGNLLIANIKEKMEKQSSKM